MIKRYYQSIIALRYRIVLMALPFAVFAFALLFERTRMPIYKTVVFILGVLLAIVLALYFYEKFSVGKSLKKISHYEEYEKSSSSFGGTYFLEDRMLTYCAHKVLESNYQDLTKISNAKPSFGMEQIQLDFPQGSVKVPVDTEEMKGKVVAFLCKKNPKIQCEGVSAQGPGTFDSICLK